MLAWGFLSLALFAWTLRGTRSTPADTARDRTDAEGQSPVQHDAHSTGFRVVIDNPLNASAMIIAALFLAKFCSGVDTLAQLAALSPWTREWRSVPLHSYGVMLGLSLVVGWQVTLRLAVKMQMTRQNAADCYVITAIAAVIGSRVLYVLTNLREFEDPVTHQLSVPAMVSLRTGGLAVYGGFLGGLFASWWYLRRHGLSLRRWADAAVPSLAIGLGITRLGCFMYGCDFGCVLPHGAPGWLRWVGTFPRWNNGEGSPAWAQQTLDGFKTEQVRCVQEFRGDWHEGVCRLGASASSSAPVHPTQLYESLLGWSILVVLMYFWQRPQRDGQSRWIARFDGQILLVATVLYGLGRSGLEILRDDRSRGIYAGLSTSQWIGLTTTAIALALWNRWSATQAVRPLTQS
jgi:phosphatidylglycerol:prolipoprotein diacylglycerol transferase